MTVIGLNRDQIQKIIDAYRSNKEELGMLDNFIKNNGITDSGITDVTESFEQGYNNALEFIFNILNIDIENLNC